MAALTVARELTDAGDGVGKGGDDTLFALRTGTVRFHASRGRKFASVDAPS